MIKNTEPEDRHLPAGPEKTILYYYTGTGNSLWIARTLAQELGHTELVSITDAQNTKRLIKAPVIGLIFPVHIWGVPRRFLDFLDLMKDLSPDYLFAIANNAGQVSNTLVQLQKVLQAKGLALSGGWSVVMPSNYIPWGGPGSAEQQNQRFQNARLKLSVIAEQVRKKIKQPVEKGPLWQRIIFSGIYKWSLPYVPKMDKNFWINEHCNQCQICIHICPSNNIDLKDNDFSWHNQCEQCLACIQWCPQKALEYGKNTGRYSRYHHPEVKLKDLIK